MFCCNCGKEIGEHKFCPECGQPAVNDGASQPQNSSSNDVSYSTATAKKKTFPWKPIILGVAVILVAFFAFNFVFGGSPERDAAIETVKNGYLGGYTDVTVEELMAYALGGMSDSEVIWDGGWTDDDEMIVEVRSEYSGGKSTVIQFKMLSEDTFKFSAMKDPALGTVSVADAIEVLNMFYYTYYMDQHGVDGAVDRLDRYSCGSVLCGSAATYKGNRKDLYMSAFDLERLTESAASYLGLYSEEALFDPLEEFVNYCDAQYFTRSDIETFDADMSLIARNAVYAHSGRKFQNERWRTYFAQYDWYFPYIEGDDFSESMFNDYQTHNLRLILDYDKEMGYR